jgi:hypothetical protein
MTLQERYEEWRSSPEGTIYSDGRPTIFTVEEWNQYKKLDEDTTSAEAKEWTKTNGSEIGKRQVGTSARSKHRKRDIEKSLRPGHWYMSLAVQGLKKDFDRFNADLPHIIEGATDAYGLTDLRIRKKK